MHYLLYSIIRSRLSERKAQTGVVVEVVHVHMADVVAHNKKVVQGDPPSCPRALAMKPRYSLSYRPAASLWLEGVLRPPHRSWELLCPMAASTWSF